jgi:Kef-type K+ transport system membrane component KefB
MLLLFDLKLPFTDPVLIFSIVLLIILGAPLLLNKIKVPGIIGLILSGVLIGPHGFNLLERNDAIVLFGTVGLLYIMFMAGLEIDLNDFKKNRNKSIVFGFYTFFIPISIGTVVSIFILDFNITSSILLASMFSTHTLIAYTIVSKMGLTKNEAVTITVGGTIITDTGALLVLAIIASSTKGELDLQFWVRLILSLAAATFMILYIFPIIARWFFRNIESEGVSQYIFSMAIVFASAFLAELAGIEPIIGAFLAGLALNRLVPHTSPLMNRIEFVGNALFIPFFLISTGMLVDYKVLFKGPEALTVAGIMIVVANLTKWLAAYFTQKTFGYTKAQRNLIFGLSNAHAAAILASVLVGYNLGILNENVLNGTILVILVTCLVSSFTTAKAAKDLAIQELQTGAIEEDSQQRIIVPISNPTTIENLIDLAVFLKDPKVSAPIYALTVVKDDEDARKKIIQNHKMLEKAISHAAATENKLQIVSRVDLNIAGGIIRAVKELMITDVVIGWNGKVTAKDKFFGSVLDHLLSHCIQMIMVVKILHPVNTFQRMVVVVPPDAEYEIGFQQWMKALMTIASQTGSQISFYLTERTKEKIQSQAKLAKMPVKVSFQIFEDWTQLDSFEALVTTNDLLVLVNARYETISYNKHFDRIPDLLSRRFQDKSFVIVYPQQHVGEFERMV